MSKALIFALINPQHDNRLFIELQVQYLHENSKLKPGQNMMCTEIVSDIQNNFCTSRSAKRRFSDKDLPVLGKRKRKKNIYFLFAIIIS